MSKQRAPSPGPRTAVFVHGAGGGGWEWNVWRRVFEAAGFAVVAPDLQPGPDGLAATSLDNYARQVADWLSASPGSIVLIGASLGGRLAQRHAAVADALVLVNPVPPAGLPGAAPSPAIVPWGRDASLAGTRRAMPDADVFAARFAFRRWRDESGQAMDQARLAEPLSKPRCPVLVIASEQDDDVPIALSAALAEAWHASLLRVPGSHVGPLLGRHAAAVAAQAVEWLNGLDRRP